MSKLYANDQIEKTKHRRIQQNSTNSAATSMLSYSSTSSNDSESESNGTETKNEEIVSAYMNDNFNIRGAENTKVKTFSKHPNKVPPKIPPPPIIRQTSNDPNNFYNEIDSGLNGNDTKLKSSNRTTVTTANNNNNKTRERVNAKKASPSSSSVDLANKELKIRESKQIFEKFFEALEQEQQEANTKSKSSRSNLQKEGNSKISTSKLTHSSSAVSVVPPLPEFSDHFKNGISSTSKSHLNSFVKLKGE